MSMISRPRRTLNSATHWWVGPAPISECCFHILGDLVKVLRGSVSVAQLVRIKLTWSWCIAVGFIVENIAVIFAGQVAFIVSAAVRWRTALVHE